MRSIKPLAVQHAVSTEQISATLRPSSDGWVHTGFWSAFKIFSKGMTAGDAYFHLLLAGCVVGGTLLAQGVGDSLWQSHNSGVCCSARVSMSVSDRDDACDRLPCLLDAQIDVGP